MKIALVCPSNILFMPYIGNYEFVLKNKKVDYEIINWDRFGIENMNKNVYKDSKIGHRRGLLDYYRYSKFIKSKLKTTKYDKLIIFGIQLAFFLQDILAENFRGKYIIDIRDYNRIIKFCRVKRLIDNSAQIVISSPGYSEWLPFSDKIVVNHNTRIRNVSELKHYKVVQERDKFRIANIGAIRDYKVNIALINSVKNSNVFELYYHGEGDVSKIIKDFVDSRGIRNVYFTGRYEKAEESSLYENADIINVLRYCDNINNKTALPNRLYNSVIFGKPMLALKGTYLADIIYKYNLGIVIDSFNNADRVIYNYIKEFDTQKYYLGRNAFIKGTIKDNFIFENKLNDFISK